MSSTTTTLTGLMSTFYDKKFLERAKEMQTYDIGAQVRSIPANGGSTVFFTRFSPLAKATTALTEATNPTFVDMTTTTVSAVVAEYGSAVKVGKLFELTSIDTGLAEHVSVIGQNAGETVDELIANELDGGGTAQIVNSVALSVVATSDIIDGSEIRKAVRALKLAKAPKFEDGYYKAIVPVSVVHDLRGDSEWLDAHRYTDAENIKNGEVGRLHGVRFFETNNEVVDADAGAGNVDVYSTFIFGKDAYGIVDIAGTSTPKVYVKNPGSGSTDNPIDMFSTIGWKVHFAAKVLNSAWLIELKSASSVGTNA
jgi:N4-gp56 family major capsid protein